MDDAVYWVYYTYVRKQEGNPNDNTGLIFGNRSVVGLRQTKDRVAELNRLEDRFAFYSPVFLKNAFW